MCKQLLIHIIGLPCPSFDFALLLRFLLLSSIPVMIVMSLKRKDSMGDGSEKECSRTDLRICVQKRGGGAVGVGERRVALGGIVFVDWALCAWKG